MAAMAKACARPSSSLLIRHTCYPIPKFWWLETRATLWYADAGHQALAWCPSHVLPSAHDRPLWPKDWKIRDYGCDAGTVRSDHFLQAGKLFKNYDQFSSVINRLLREPDAYAAGGRMAPVR
jgi:hypothetical protein